MKLKAFFTITTLISGAVALAGVQEIPTLSEADAQINVAQVQNSFVLKKAVDGNPTRITLVVKDLGGSTDVSPKLGLYLVFWQDGEMGDASAAFDLGNTYSLVDFSPQGNGVLQLQLKKLNDDSRFVVETVTVDYSEFAKKFRKEAATVEEEFATEWVVGSIYTKVAQ